MLDWLKTLGKNKPAGPATLPVEKTEIIESDPNQLKPLSADELFRRLDLHPAIKEIRRLSSVSDQHWIQLYLTALKDVAAIIQLIPASQSHHHSGPGGLLQHTVEVCHYALRRSKSYQLPQNVGPEERAKREHTWRFGIFTAALLHDIGKTLLSAKIKLTLDTGETKIWSPYLGPMPHNTRFYRCLFQSSPYKMHQLVAPTLFSLIPPTARHWLLQDTALMHELIAYLSGNLYECGVIGEIVSQSDQESVAKNLKLGNNLRFPGIIHLPLVDRIMTALRHLLQDGTLKLNRNGAAGWVYEDKTYMVCRTTANAVQEYLRQKNATDIPEDVTRLYDIWQEHGFVIENDNNGAIWKVSIHGDDYQLTLTVLVFETKQLFKLGHHPEPMSGHIEILQSDENEPVNDNTGADNQSPEPTQEQAATSKASTQPESDLETEPGSSQSINVEPNTFDGLPKFQPPNSEASQTPEEVIQQSSNSETELEQPTVTGANPFPDLGNLPDTLSPEIGQYFIDWVKVSVQDRSIRVNRADTPVHITALGVALVTPAILKRFCTAMDIPPKTGDEPSWKVIQNAFHKLKLHIKSPAKTNIHTLIIKGANRQSKINAYIIPIDLIYNDLKPPAVNEKIEIFEL